jgi:hypothetical protein
MSLQYRSAWTTRTTAQALRNLRWVEFSSDGKWLVTANDRYVYVLSALDGLVRTRVRYTDSPASIVWLPKSASTLVCGYTHGTIINLSLSLVSDCRIAFGIGLTN